MDTSRVTHVRYKVQWTTGGCHDGNHKAQWFDVASNWWFLGGKNVMTFV